MLSFPHIWPSLSTVCWIIISHMRTIFSGSQDRFLPYHRFQFIVALLVQRTEHANEGKTRRSRGQPRLHAIPRSSFADWFEIFEYSHENGKYDDAKYNQMENAWVFDAEHREKLGWVREHSESSDVLAFSEVFAEKADTATIAEILVNA
jgi:hypothetical protein